MGSLTRFYLRACNPAYFPPSHSDFLVGGEDGLIEAAQGGFMFGVQGEDEAKEALSIALEEGELEGWAAHLATHLAQVLVTDGVRRGADLPRWMYRLAEGTTYPSSELDGFIQSVRKIQKEEQA